MFKSGDKVVVKKHKCGIDKIGPFETVINYIEDGVADVTDPEGNDWGVSLRNIQPVQQQAAPAKRRNAKRKPWKERIAQCQNESSANGQKDGRCRQV